METCPSYMGSPLILKNFSEFEIKIVGNDRYITEYQCFCMPQINSREENKLFCQNEIPCLEGFFEALDRLLTFDLEVSP